MSSGPPAPALELLAHEIRPAAAEPAGALVLLHGRGTDRFDLLPLLDALDPRRRLVGVTVEAPLMLPPGGFHWYLSRAPGHPERETFDATYATLGRWLEALPAAVGVGWAQTVLGGFSQGAAMSLALTLGAGRPRPAGLLALSGFIPVVQGFDIDLSQVQGLPVAIGHGTLDPVVPVPLGRQARDLLEQAGAEVLYRESPMKEHGIDPAFVAELRGWLEGLTPTARGPGMAALS